LTKKEEKKEEKKEKKRSHTIWSTRNLDWIQCHTL